MYSEQEASFVRQKFWINFGRYISPIPSSSGEKVNWINYKTGIKHLNFKMDARSDGAYIAIELSHPDETQREVFFKHFNTFKKPLQDLLEEKWQWEPLGFNENGMPVARIYNRLSKINIHREDDWPAIISFLKTRIVLLDKFWVEYKDIFEMIN